MLTVKGCTARQQRLFQEMEQRQWDLFATTSYRAVYYFTGMLVPEDVPVLFAAFSNGDTVLLGPAGGEPLAQRRIEVPNYSIRRLIDYPERDLVSAWQDYLSARKVQRAGVYRRVSTGGMEDPLRESMVEDATDMVLRMRRRKESDEVDEIRRSLDLCRVAYTAARSTMAPGMREVDVYAEMYSAVVRYAGTAVEFKGDFACGERCIRGGGPPTDRLLKEGDLYILDLFPAIALYFGDTCRTYAVTEPTTLQRQAWELVHAAVEMGEQAVRPGVSVKAVYQQVKDFLDSHELTDNSFFHHLGHGIGHRGHEAPRIIPASDEVFEEGDVITLEPGVYTQALSGGIRLEDNYIVRAGGLENLFDYPRGLDR